jgi:hypothetical protein
VAPPQPQKHKSTRLGVWGFRFAQRALDSI